MANPQRSLYFVLVALLIACGAGDIVSPGEMPSTTGTAAVGDSTPPSESATSSPIPVDQPTASTGAGGASPTTTKPPISTSTTTAPEQGPFAAIPDQIIQIVLADAAKTSGLAASAIRVLTTESGDWSDGSLGCPEPGKSYTQVLVPGYRVTVDAGGTVVEYHLNSTGDFKICTGGVLHPSSGS